MASEVSIFLQALVQVLSSLWFCFSIRNLIPKGFLRFLLVLPSFFLFLYIPLRFQTVHLQGSLGFLIGWLASFKLLLFAFGKGPLCSHSSSSSLGRFLVVGSLPIEIPDDDPSSVSAKPNATQNGTALSRSGDDGPVLQLSSSAKFGFLIVTFIPIYYKHYLHPNVSLIFYSLAIYLLLENLLGVAAALARATLGVELEPHFNEPYLSSSLQDFWGRRWNLMASKILRLAVYEPSRDFAAAAVGKKMASLTAMAATFVVSGLMHELIYFYMGRVEPTWEVTCFFLLHGVCLPAEILVKQAVGGRFRLPRVISAPLTIGFMMMTSFWLFFPQFLRCNIDVRMFEDYAAVGAWVKRVVGELITPFISFQVK